MRVPTIIANKSIENSASSSANATMSIATSTQFCSHDHSYLERDGDGKWKRIMTIVTWNGIRSGTGAGNSGMLPKMNQKSRCHLFGLPKCIVRQYTYPQRSWF